MCTLWIQFILWLVLSILSFLPVKTLGWTCVQSIRCGDRFFIHNAYYRKSQENPGYSYNYHTDKNPRKVFANEQDCLNYCKTDNVEAPQNSGREAATTSNEALGVLNATTKAPNQTDDSNVNYTTITEPTDLSNVTSVTTIVPTPPRTSQGPPTQPASPRNGTCKCYKEKKEIITLIGPQTAVGHIALAVVFTVLIALVWYLYSICILWSYINFLKAPPRGSRASKTSR